MVGEELTFDATDSNDSEQIVKEDKGAVKLDPKTQRQQPIARETPERDRPRDVLAPVIVT